MQNRILALLVTLVSILNFGGCDTDDPVVPVEVQTDYDFVVVNETAIDFVVYRKSSINGYVWELMDPLGGLSEVPYRSEIDATYLLFFCREGDAAIGGVRNFDGQSQVNVIVSTVNRYLCPATFK